MPQKEAKVPICVLVGGGSKLPALIQAANSPKSRFYISLVVSHKAASFGVDLAIKNKIPAVYFKLPDFRNRLYNGNEKARVDYMQKLGWFISQKEYDPKLLVFAGWDLVMDSNFFQFFKCTFGNGYSAINLHPAILPQKGEKKEISLPDGNKTQVIKGEQQHVLEEVLRKRLTYFGPSIHFMVDDDFDTGEVINREFIKVEKEDTIEKLRAKLMPVEDKLLIESINQVIEHNLL